MDRDGPRQNRRTKKKKTNKELLAVVTAVGLFKYYLTGRHFTVVTDYVSLTWL